MGTKRPPTLKAKKWQVLTAVVDGASAGYELFIDGKLALTSKADKPTTAEDGGEEKEFPEWLGLGHRVLLFGGGKQAETRGGVLRTVKLVDGELSAEEVKNACLEVTAANPLYRDGATRIQAAARRRAVIKAQPKRDWTKLEGAAPPEPEDGYSSGDY